MKDKARLYYWKLVFWSLFNRPQLLPLALTYSIYGFHFRKVFKNNLELRNRPYPSGVSRDEGVKIGGAEAKEGRDGSELANGAVYGWRVEDCKVLEAANSKRSSSTRR